MQNILLLLIHQRPDLPAPLVELSPWLDHLVEPLDSVVARLEAQQHRRVVKTHTPLDGIPLDPLATYVVVARHPLDAAVSLYHQGDNLDRERMQELTGVPQPSPSRPRRDPREWLRGWIEEEADPTEMLESLPGVFWHLSEAWSRRDDANVMLVHYADLLADLDGQMRRLAAAVSCEVPESMWDDLVRAATLNAMRGRADQLAPNAARVLRSADAFFRRGSSGAARELLDDADLERYHARVAALAPPELLGWLHR